MEKNVNIDHKIPAFMVLREVAKLMVNNRKELKEGLITANFNGICLKADESSTIESIIVQYNEALRASIKAYRQTDQYNLKKQQDEAKMIELKTTAENLMIELESLDFKNLRSILNWIKRFQPCSQRIELVYYNEKILSKFSENGFLPNANLDADFNNDDKENVAKYIIGQALNMLKKYTFTLVIGMLIDSWIDRFEPK